MEAPTGDPSEHRFRFRSDSDAAHDARQVLRDLGAALPSDVLTDLELCVTELVTNSVQHADARADDEVEMRVWVRPAGIRVEVGDRGRGFETSKSRRFGRGSAAGGWGLYIVDVLADRWGVDRRDLTWVWFEIDLEEAGARA
jgi:anti-sigma regulatory factor (Ser/Thr protein kinase)